MKQASIDSKVLQHAVLITKTLVERHKKVVMNKDRCLPGRGSKNNLKFTNVSEEPPA
jgi:hypothetical protein